MRRPLTSLIALGAASVLALAGCAGGAGSQSGRSSVAEEELGPLDAYFSALWDQEEWTQERYDEENLRREELIAQCMTKEGFEYVPNTNNGGTVMYEDDYDGPAWDSLEFAERYGYGVVDWPGREDVVEDDSSYEEYVDPNQGYIDSLSESEQQAYFETLYGVPQEYEEPLEGEEEVYEYDWEENGCWGWAENELNAGSVTNAWEDPEFEDLFAALEEMWTASQEAPDIVAANQEWVTCMDEAGFPGFVRQEDAMNSMYERQNQIYEDASTDGEEWVEPDRALFDALQEEEIALATADWKCKDKVNYNERLRKADFQAQQDFVDTHRAQLDALVAKYSVKSQSS